MAIKITDACINCGACEPECPNNAIYEGGIGWKWSEGTNLINEHKDGALLDIEANQKPFSDEFYYIVTDKCTECVGFHNEPQCASVCPVNCCVPDMDNQETQEQLLEKKNWLHSA